MDVLAAILHVEHLRLEAHAVALVARNEDVREELHLDAHFALALACLAAPARHVEREVARGEAARFRVPGQREDLANRIERLQIRDRIRARRAADRRLIDEDDVADVFEPLEPAEGADASIPVALRPLDGGVEHVVHERRLARPAHAGHARQRVERNGDIDVLQVVLRRAAELELLRQAAPTR